MSDLQNPTPGPRFITDGQEGKLRNTRTGELTIANVHGPYHESASRQMIWTVRTATAGITVTALMVVSGASATAIPIIGLRNASGSARLLSLIDATIHISSGTLGANGFHWAMYGGAAGAAISTGSQSAGVSHYLGTAGTTVGYAFAGATALTGASGDMLAMRMAGGPTTGAAAANAPLTFYEYLDGKIVLGPGVFIGLFAGAAGTSPIVSASLTWEEVPATA